MKAGFTVKLAKCEFACSELEYIGHKVGLGVMSPKLLKVNALINTPKPINKRQLQLFLGFANYYKQYLKQYSTIAYPLTDMLRKDKKIVWTSECECSFQEIKRQLSESPVLLIADYNKPFVLYVDASNLGVGAALMQKDNGVQKPVCYFSKKLKDTQRRYSTSDREALALVLAVRAFRTYLSVGNVVYTDHEPLKFIEKMAGTNQRLLRWSLELQPYNLDI